MLRRIVAYTVALGVCTGASPEGEYQAAEQPPWVSLTVFPSRVTLHEPVFLRLVFPNETDELLTLDVGVFNTRLPRLRLTDPDGVVTVVNPASAHGDDNPPLPVNLFVQPRRSRIDDLVLTEMFEFRRPGVYRLAVELTAETTGAGSFKTLSQTQAFSIRILPRDERVLRATIERFVREAEDLSSGANRIRAAKALSRIGDPIVIPYLERLIQESRWVLPDQLAPGIERIGTDEARQALLRLGAHADASKAQAALRALDRLNARANRQ